MLTSHGASGHGVDEPRLRLARIEFVCRHLSCRVRDPGRFKLGIHAVDTITDLRDHVARCHDDAIGKRYGSQSSNQSSRW